jgi:hypothetical protein
MTLSPRMYPPTPGPGGTKRFQNRKKNGIGPRSEPNIAYSGFVLIHTVISRPESRRDDIMVEKR